MSALPLPPPGPRRRPTTTARFGSSRREAHDASGFYERFVPPEVSTDASIGRTEQLDVIHHASATDMASVGTGSVALVVTSPPYFAGKAYEQDLGTDGVPGTYFEYLELLTEVFAECKRVLEPGGRIAVNVANLGRRPFRSLAGDVTTILSDLGLLLRGEVVWWKGRAAGGSCAWGSFQRPANPVLRDVTERVVLASKGRFDRALTARQRHERGLPSTATITRDEFLDATTDLWELPPESATRLGHPAPFPVDLPRRLIDLYTYAGDVVVDPFVGSGTTAVAAIGTGRHFVGYDIDAGYVAAARRRIAATVAGRAGTDGAGVPTGGPVRAEIPAVPAETPAGAGYDAVIRGERDGVSARDLAGRLLQAAGFTDVRRDVKLRGLGVDVDFAATDGAGKPWAFLVTGAFSTNRAGLRRAETLWRALGQAAVLHQAGGPLLILVTTDLPTPGSAGAQALAAVWGDARPVVDVIALGRPEDRDRLARWAAGS